MDIQINNSEITIKDYTSDFSKKLHELLSYVDKSKQYQIRKMSRNVFSRNSDYYKKLVASQNGTLVDEQSGVITVPSGFAYLFKNHSYIDNRKETGKQIALPWKKKPYELRDYQSEANTLMGCHAAGQQILMFDGSFKLVEEVEVGDKLMGPDSLPRTVLALNRGRDELFNIIPAKGESFCVNSEHILSLKRSYSSIRPTSKNKYKHKDRTQDDEIVNISVKQYLQQNKAFKHKYKLYRSEAISFEDKELPLDPYILGLWLGDGASKGPEFCSIDAEIVNAFHEFALSQNLELKLKNNSENKCPTYRLTSNGKVGANNFLNTLKQLNLLDNKHIPELYKTSSIKQRLELLAGLLDTDGCYYEGVFDITQKNKQIADSIVYIARSLGLAAYIKPSYKEATNSKLRIKNLYYRVIITGLIEQIPTRLPRKQAHKRKQVKNVLNIGFSIVAAGYDNYYGFTVDHDNLYLLSDFTVTHNCNYRGLINFATGLGKTLTAIYAIRSIGRRTLVLCPTQSIADNFYQELCDAFGDDRVGYFGGGKKQLKDITVGIAASVNNHVEKFAKHELGLVIADECFPYRTNINTEDGPKEIGWLVKQWEEKRSIPRIMSFNEKTKQFEYKTMTYGWRKTREDLIEIKYSKRKFKCTPEHKLLTSRGWVSAKDLVSGDYLLGITGDKSEKYIVPTLNDDQYHIILGSLLGDGHLGISGNNRVRLTMTHGVKQETYARWKASVLNASVSTIEKNGYSQKPAIRVSTKCFDFDLKLCGSKKDIPQECIDKIDARSLAIWYMDDGSMVGNGSGAKIATCSFSKETIDRLCTKLHGLGVECRPIFNKYSDHRAPGYWEIYINKRGFDSLVNMIAPYIHESMLYKINNINITKYIWNTVQSKLGTGLVERVTAVTNKVLKGRQPFVFDIEIEDNHNFIICSQNDNSGIIAHNCHHLAAETFYNITKTLSPVGRMFGLTATDFRSDGKDVMIQAGVGEVLIKRDIIWGIENKWLAYPNIIMRNVETTGREYAEDKNKNYKAHVLNSQEMNDRILQDVKKCLDAGKSVLCLVDEKEHGKMLSEALGLPFATGDDKGSRLYIKQLNEGSIPGLIGTDSLVGEGTDTKNVDVLVLANFVASKGPLWQNLGRGLRRQGTKTHVLVLDYRPKGSKMLSRHADQRLKLYKLIPCNIKEV